MSFASDIGRMVAKGPQAPMTTNQTRELMGIMFMSELSVEDQIRRYKGILQDWPILAIMDERFRLHVGEDVPFSPTLMIWLASLADRPGFALLMVAVMAHLRAEGRELTLNSLIASDFQDGIPSPVNLQLAWDAQKVTKERVDSLGTIPWDKIYSDNMLDLQESWK